MAIVRYIPKLQPDGTKMKKPLLISALSLLALSFHLPLQAGEADVIKAELTHTGNGTFRASVTVKHADEGWDHYADAWEILAPDGTVLATRTLAHPHVNEQPFTRSLGGIKIPDDIDAIRIRARDSQHGFGGKELTLKVTR